MKKTIVLGVIIMSLLSFLSGCGKKRTATLSITGGTYVNTSVYVPDEEKAETAAPAAEVITVKVGDEFKDFKVKKITADTVTIESEFTRYSCTIRENGKLVKKLDSKTVFSAKVGQSIDLDMLDIMDASYSISIQITNID